MALLSPGLQITVIDQSQYLPAPPASVPLIIMATAQNKVDASGTAIAPGTLAANANKLYAVTSQRDLIGYFGTPLFYTTTDGTSINGYQLNEYGLLAAYSVLGVSNLAYVIRADIDLAALKGSVGRPSAAPADGSFWLNTTTTSWGIFQFNQSTGAFTLISPIVITDPNDVSLPTCQPIQSVGNIGDYAVTLVTEYGSPTSYDTYWFKNTSNEWVAFGSPEWNNSWPTVQGTNTPVTVSAGSIVINGITVTVPVTPNNTVEGVVGQINSSNIHAISAANVDGRLQVYSNSSAVSAIIGAGSTAGVLSDLGVTVGTYYSPSVAYGTNAQQPLWRTTDAQPHPTGSVWVKTNSPNGGTSISFSKYSAATASYSTISCPLAMDDWTINNTLDTSGGQYIPVNSVYAQYNFDGVNSGSPLQLYVRSSSGTGVWVGTTTAPSFDNNATFEVYVSVPNSASLSGPYVVTMPSTGTLGATAFVSAWTAANIPNTTASVGTTGAIVLTHTVGGVIIMDDSGVTTPASAVTDAGFTINSSISSPTGPIGAKWGSYKTISYPYFPATNIIGTGAGCSLYVSTVGYTPTFTIAGGGSSYNVGDVLEIDGGGYATDPYTVRVTETSTGAVSGVEWLANFATPQYTVQLSNWEIFNYTPSLISPVGEPTNGTNWYYSTVDQVDIMTNVGGVWTAYQSVGYTQSGLPSASVPNTTNPTGPLVQANAPSTQSDGVTPLAYGDLWVNTSNLSEYPLLNRWQNYNGVDQWVLIDNTDHTTENGILFADARWADSGTIDPINDPIPTITSLLISDYLDLDAPMGDIYPQGTLLWNTRRSSYNVKQWSVNYFNGNTFPDAILPEFTSTWVTISGNSSNGAPYMGAAAQRILVVEALRTTIDTTTQLRDEDTFLNLIAAPGYEEVEANLCTLNNDRGQTAYVIGDTPMTLAANAQDILNWARNTAGSTSTNRDGLVTRDTYMGLYYPSGITNDLTGKEVVVPSSHMILRTMIYNDTVAYPWFAPAGQRRGVITNATNIGYIDAQSGNFIVDKNNQGLRDVEYTNFINPIASFTNIGILNYGNKNSFDSQSALDRTNVARLIVYLRTQLATAVRPFLFEPNDNTTRTAVRGVCQTLLSDIMNKRGVYDYLVVCDTTNNTPAIIDANELYVDIAIEPTKAVEFIYIPIRILNTGAIAGIATNG